MTTASEKLTEIIREKELGPQFLKLRDENKSLKDQLFEARQALLKEGMRVNALQARIDGGIRMYAFSVGGVEALELFSDPEKLNATLILDEGAGIGNFE